MILLYTQQLIKCLSISLMIKLTSLPFQIIYSNHTFKNNFLKNNRLFYEKNIDLAKVRLLGDDDFERKKGKEKHIVAILKTF